MFPIAVLLALSASPAEELLKSAGSILREEVITILHEKKAIPVKLSGFTGTIAAVDPNKTLNVTVRKMTLEKDTGSLQVSVAGEWLLKGKLKVGTINSDVTLRLKATVEVTAGATIQRVRDEFVAQPVLGDVDLKGLEIVSLDPEPFPGAKLFLPAGIRTLWKTEKANLQKMVAEELGDIPLPQPKLVLPTAGTHDNKLIRQYVQSMIAEQILPYDSPRTGFKFDENLPYLHAVGGVWLDDPTRRLKVNVHFITLHEGVLYWEGEVEAPLRGHCRLTIPDTVTGLTDFVGTARVRIGGDIEMKDGQPGGCNVYRLTATLENFSVSAAPFRIVQRTIESLANRLAGDLAKGYAREIEKQGGGPNKGRLVEAGYLRVLGRKPDPQGVRDWTRFLEDRTPREMMAALAVSPEYEVTYLKGKDEEAVVKAMWKTALGREPIPVELDRWSKWLKEKVTVYEERTVRVGPLRREKRQVPVGVRNRSYRDMAPLLAESAEYRLRFGDGLPR